MESGGGDLSLKIVFRIAAALGLKPVMALKSNAHAAAEAHRPAAEPAGARPWLTRCKKTSFGKFAIWCRKPSHGSPPASLAVRKPLRGVAPWLAGGKGGWYGDREGHSGSLARPARSGSSDEGEAYRRGWEEGNRSRRRNDDSSI